MTNRERMLATIQSQPSDQIPWLPFFEEEITPWLPLVSDRVHQAGKFLPTHTDGNLTHSSILGP